MDTHILLWWLSDDKKLDKRVRMLLANPNNHILVSSISVWEIVIKKTLGKLVAPDNIKEILDTGDFDLLPMTVDHAFAVQDLPFLHSDPFDRLLIAQCLVEDVVFITEDKFIPQYNITCF